jgi:hypothetical protein
MVNAGTASALASSRVWLLLGGVLVVSESILLATTLFAAAAVSLVAGLVIAARLYGVRTPPSEGG